MSDWTMTNEQASALVDSVVAEAKATRNRGGQPISWSVVLTHAVRLGILVPPGTWEPSADDIKAAGERLHAYATHGGGFRCPPTWSGHWREWYRKLARIAFGLEGNDTP